MKHLIAASQAEADQRPVARNEPTPDMVEKNSATVGDKLGLPKGGAAPDEAGVAIDQGPGSPGQPLPNRLFQRGMDLIGQPAVGRDDTGCKGKGLGRYRNRFSHFCPSTAGPLAYRAKGRELDGEKPKPVVPKRLSPGIDQRRQLPPVGLCPTDVRFALVPDDAL